MSSKNYARIILLLPYFFLIEALIYSKLHPEYYETVTRLDKINDFWLAFARYWFVPFTILAVYLLLWSRNKTVEEIRFQYSISPFILLFISGLFYLAVLIVHLIFVSVDYKSGVGFIGFIIFSSIPMYLVIGYAFVGIAFMLYFVLKRIGMITD